MSYLWLPKGTRAMRRAEEERTEAEQSVQHQQQLVEGGASDDPASEPSAKLRQKAQVWKTYLKETDRWDKEMVEERNNSLDVMLIFAALFSAISTTFIVESLTHLQPDPAESSAQTLIVISQTLMAMANNQSAALLASHPIAATASPSPAQLVVNVLWLLSLSLSVAVSLIAMLAKDWCYKFMFGRSGQVYEQARRRQQRWNAMEKWKMKQLLTYLPGMMHMALSLFAIGLCVYLWDINIGVAIPVIIITALATLVYTVATILPLMDQFSPYSTSTTAVLLAAKPIAMFFYDALTMVVVVLAFLLFMLLACFIPHKWLDEAQETATRTAQDALDGIQDTLGLDSDRLVLVKPEVPMDVVTSQMLAWIITNCEDSRSVDIALQAIAGASYELPYEPLAQCSARDLIIQRLKLCVSWDSSSEKVIVKDASRMSEALTYCGAYSILVSQEKYRSDRDTWNPNADEIRRNSGREYEDLQMMKVVAELLEQAMLEMKTSKSLNTNILAATAAAAMPFCHWDWSPSPSSEHKYIAPNVASSVLKHHLEKSSAANLSASTLYALAESTVHYLIGLWPNEEQHGLYSLLPLQLAQIYSSSRDTAPDTSRAAAVILAATALAADSYPGGERPSQSFDTRERRAVNLIDYYRANQPANDVVSSLFLFGFIGLLPRLSFKGLGILPAAGTDLLNQVKKSVAPFNFKDGQTNIHTLPATFSLLEHAGLAAWQCLTSVENDTFSSEDEPIVTFACSSFLLLRESLNTLYPRIYGVALLALQRATSKELQDICIKLIDTQQLPDNPLQFFGWFGSEGLLQKLSYNLAGDRENVSRFALLRFRLLIADVMLSPQYSLDQRRSTLQPLLSSRLEFASLTPLETSANPLDTNRIINHVKEINEEEPMHDAMRHTMQLVADFCGTDVTPLSLTGAEAGPHLATLEWQTKRQELRNSLKQGATKDELAVITEVHHPRIVIQGEATAERVSHV